MDRLRRLMALSGLVLLGLGGQVAGMGAGDYASLDELLSDFVDPDEPGVVVLVNVGGTRESAARGMADLAEGRSIRVGDQFRIGSATKPFVAALVLQLVEEGRMSLDEPIATYLPPDMVPRIANVRRASVAQVLAMTSGVPDYTASDEFDERVRQRPSYPWQAAEVVAFVFDEPASFDPGTDYEYSNTNYILAQLAIERVLNTTLQQAMAERMFEPLGLTGSFVEMPGRFAEGIVTGYEDHRGWEDVTRINDGVGLGDGGVVSSRSRAGAPGAGSLGRDAAATGLP
jgi:D-alanyl-D-alanine carboxypeptidase